MTKKNRNLFIVLILVIVAVAALLISKNTGKTKNEDEPKTPKKTFTLFDFQVSDIQSILVNNPEGGFQLYSPDGEQWLAAPVSDYFKLSPDVAKNAVRNLATITSHEKISGNASEQKLSEFGLDKPFSTVTVKTKNNTEKKLFFGNKSPSGTGRYAMQEGKSAIYLVRNYVSSATEGTPAKFRDMSLPSPDLQKLAGFTYRRNGVLFQAIPSKSTDPYTSGISSFEVVSPFKTPYPLDDYELQNAFSENTPLPTSIACFDDELDPSDPLLGLSPEEADIIKLDDTDGVSLNILIGAPAGNNHRYAITADTQGPVFELNTYDLQILDCPPIQFISKFVMLASLENIQQVKIESENDTWYMIRNPAGDEENLKDDLYKVNNIPVDQSHFSKTYQKCIGIMYEGVITENKPLGKPEVRITYKHVDENIPSTSIRFYPYDSTFYQVVVDNKPLEFLVGRYQLKQLTEDLAALSEFAS